MARPDHVDWGRYSPPRKSRMTVRSEKGGRSGQTKTRNARSILALSCPGFALAYHLSVCLAIITYYSAQEKCVRLIRLITHIMISICGENITLTFSIPNQISLPILASKGENE